MGQAPGCLLTIEHANRRGHRFYRAKPDALLSACDAVVVTPDHSWKCWGLFPCRASKRQSSAGFNGLIQRLSRLPVSARNLADLPETSRINNEASIDCRASLPL